MEDGPSNPPTVGRRIVRASMAVGVAHILFKLISFVQAVVVGKYLDGATFDAVYAFAFEGCIFTFFLVGEESIGPTFLPMFMREMDTRDEKAAWRFANVVLTFQFILLLLVVFLIAFFPDRMLRLVTYWNAARDPEKYSLARQALVWMAPALVFLSLASTTYKILNGYKRFFIAALGDACWRFCVVLAALVGMGLFGLDHRAVVFGLLAGSLAKLATHLLGLLRECRLFRPSLDWRNPAFKGMILLMLPLLCGILFAKARDLFNNVTILTYLETDGLLKANSFGRKLHTTIGWLVPYAISIAIFPFLCELVDRKDRDKLGQILTTSGRMLLAVFIPFTLVSVVLARPLSYLIFHGGQFSAQETEWTAVSMSCYILVLPAYALEYLLMQAFFAHRRMISIAVSGIVFSSLSVAASYLGIVVLGATGVAALMTVALGFTIGRILKTILLVFLLKRNVPFLPGRETLLFLLKALLCGVLAAACAFLGPRAVNRLFSADWTRLLALARLAAGAAGAALGFLLAVRLLRLREPLDMARWTLARLRRRPPA